MCPPLCRHLGKGGIEQYTDIYLGKLIATLAEFSVFSVEKFSAIH